MDIKPMFNAYPDSLGGKLSDIVKLFSDYNFSKAFSSFYILPSLFKSDLDRGFCVVSYDLNKELADEKDLEKLRSLGIKLKLDFVLNHLSATSPQFLDLLEKGQTSEYSDFFINWNEFWKGCGPLTEEGYISPDPELIKNMFFRKPGLPILMVEDSQGNKTPYWNTFYQKVTEENGKKKYLGQIDLNVNSGRVWNFYCETLKKLSEYGADIIRLDAFAYASKAKGKRNFLNPETWDILSRIKDETKDYNLSLLPEIHESYEKGIYKQINQKGYPGYDFFLPGLLLYCIEKKDSTVLADWANQILNEKLNLVNMLGCHDGIPLLDLKGLISDDEIEELIDLVVNRGGYVKNLYGQKNIYYQVNATYYSALGEEDSKLLLARAIQLFMPEKPQIWYLDLFAGKNDIEAVKRGGEGAHKEINRTNLNWTQIKEGLKKTVVQEQLKLLELRNTHPAFNKNADIKIGSNKNKFLISWKYNDHKITLFADLADYTYRIEK